LIVDYINAYLVDLQQVVNCNDTQSKEDTHFTKFYLLVKKTIFFLQSVDIYFTIIFP